MLADYNPGPRVRRWAKIGDVEVDETRLQPSRPWIVHSDDWPNVVRIVLGLPIFLLPLWIGIRINPGGVALALLIGFALNDMNFLLHQHVHCRLSERRWVNNGLDAVLGVMTGMTSSNWRQHHVLRHHQLDDSWGEGYAWEMRRRSVLGAITYSVRGAVVVIVRPYLETITRGVFRGEKAPINYRVAFVQQTLNFAVMAFLISRVPVFYAPFYAMVWIFTRRTDYENHVGCDDSDFGFANNVIDDRYNWLRNNFGYHTAHHLHPSAHWSSLPGFHAEIADQIPAERIEGIRLTRTLNPMLLVFELRSLRRLRRASKSLAA